MLIETPYKNLDTVTIKLTDSSEIVARLEDENDTQLTLYKPLALIATEQGMGLSPFAFTIPADAKVKINKSTVIFVHKTDAEMAKQYTKSTTGVSL
jgi:phosphohistidine swiveling domain-containing protein